MRGIHYTCQGESHKATNKVCQDYSFIHINDDYSIAIVCDGHGGEHYFRSDIGAKMAAEVTTECVEEFLTECSQDVFSEIPFTQKESLETEINGGLMQKASKQDKAFRQLFSSIIYRWRERILDHARTHPLSDLETKSLKQEYLDSFNRQESLEKNYGCTLMCYVCSNLFWIAFHIGDGKCISFDKDGNYIEPIPWDEHCFLNKTTSLCDENALNEFRYCFCGDGTHPAAVFLGSDGIDDSFGETNNLIYFYAQIVKLLANSSLEEAQAELKSTLPELSKLGSKDDMSVACVYDESSIRSISIAITRLQQKIIEEKINNLDDIIDLNKRKIEQEDIGKIDFEYAEKTLEKSIQSKQKLIEKWNNLEKEIYPFFIRTYDNNMKFLGSFFEAQIPYSTEGYGQLLYYPNNERDIKEIKIYYDFNKPFLVKAIAMLTENNGSVLKYDVYEYEYYAETDVEVKNHIKKLVEPPCGENTCTIK
jgi:serine/threonine protein phosphatase PrpC